MSVHIHGFHEEDFDDSIDENLRRKYIIPKPQLHFDKRSFIQKSLINNCKFIKP